MTPPGRREQNKADKRARILAAGTRLLAEHGYDGMTMAQVAQEAQVGIGTVFSYAATKAELLMMITAERWRPVLAGLTSDPAHPPGDRVEQLLAPLREWALVEPQTSAAIARELLFGSGGPHRDELVAVVAGLEDAVAAVLVEAGAGPARAAAAGRLVIGGGIVELHRTRTGRAGPDTADERVRALVELACAGALATPGSETSHAYGATLRP